LGVRERRMDRLIRAYRRRRGEDTHKEAKDKMSNNSKNIS